MSDFESQTSNFKSWIGLNFSYLSPKFQITDLREKNQGRGLLACDDIACDEILFKIPRNAILNVDTGALSVLNKDLLMALNQWQALILTVAFEWFLENESKWSSYFNVVPLKQEDYNSLIFWNKEECQMLYPSTVLDRIAKKESDDMYDMLALHLKDFNVKDEFRSWFSRERFHIVASLILSYSFDVDHPEEVERLDNEEDEPQQEGEQKHKETCQDDCKDSCCSKNAEEEAEEEQDDSEGDEEAEEENDDDDDDEIPIVEPLSEDTYFKSMVPLADTLNSNTRLCNATLHYEKNQLIMKAVKPISNGEQIYNIYGELPNSEILRKYGYVELPSSKFEFVQLSMDDIMAYFINKYQLELNGFKEPLVIKLVTTIFELIQGSEYLDMQLEDSEGGIVLSVYEIYPNGEVLAELVLLLLIVNTVLTGLASDLKWSKKLTRGLEKRLNSDLESFIHRTILKCHQLLEDHATLTQSTYQSLRNIVEQKINSYPTHIINNFQLPEKASAKQDMANVVLFNEYLCLKDIMDGKFPIVNEDGLAKFKIIEDEKLLKNLLKRKTEQEENRSNKRHRK